MMSECSKCGGEMIQGEVFIEVTNSSGSSMGGMISPMSGINLGNIGMMKEERIKWREKTGKKKGFLIKSDEVHTTAVTGRRCMKCGYIELYVRG